MNEDIAPILKSWTFDPDDICARKISGLDGREKLQVRVDLGVLQMELDGRPDGACPHDCHTVLAYHLSRLEAYRTNHGSGRGFVLNEEACAELEQEGFLYYQRYTCLMSLEDYEGVVRDTAHNIAIFDLVNEFAEDEDYKFSFEQYRPYVIMVHTRARGELCLLGEDFDGALEVLQEGIEAIQSFFEAFGDPELTEPSEELQALEEWAEEIRAGRPRDLKQRLSEQLQEAIAEEKYEQAAELRDRLRRLRRINS